MPRHIGTTEGEYSVVQSFVSGEQEYVRAWVSAKEAVEAFNHYTNSVAVKMGFVTEVIITDGGDQTNMRWEKGKGITFPDPETLAQAGEPDEPNEEESSFTRDWSSM